MREESWCCHFAGSREPSRRNFEVRKIKVWICKVLFTFATMTLGMKADRMLRTLMIARVERSNFWIGEVQESRRVTSNRPRPRQNINNSRLKYVLVLDKEPLMRLSPRSSDAQWAT